MMSFLDPFLSNFFRFSFVEWTRYFHFTGLVFILCALFFSIMLRNTVINVFFSKNDQAIDIFFRKRKSNPYYCFVYSIANCDDRGVIKSYRKLVTKKINKQFYPYLPLYFPFIFIIQKE
ncbi:MAG: hypothetical protein ABF649_16410, partial [Bacillus sp. (in: firmicutes)]